MLGDLDALTLERNVLFAHTVYLSQLDQVRQLHSIAVLIYIQITARFGLRKSLPMSNNYSYNSLYRLKLSGQSYTSPILR